MAPLDSPRCQVRVDRIFDSAIGYSGEGWPNLSMNTRSLTHERIEYCKSVQYDILVITELDFITNDPKIVTEGPRQGECRYPTVIKRQELHLSSQIALSKM